MFSVLSAVLDYVLEKAFDNKFVHSVSNNYISTFFTAPNTDQDFLFDDLQKDVLLLELIDEREKAAGIQTQRCTGKVTHVCGGHGLIDGTIYFATEDIFGSNPVQVDDVVKVVASQQHQNGGWTAQSVTVVESLWQGELDEPVTVPTGEVGKVNQLDRREGVGIINDNVRFDVDCCEEGYCPCVGDWVTVELDLSMLLIDKHAIHEHDIEDEFLRTMPQSYQYAACVAPLRRWSFNGTVTSVSTDHGYIDDDVYFSIGDCLNCYRPRKFDVVKVYAIESTQGHCSWRAISVIPTTSDSSAFGLRNSMGKQDGDKGRGFLVPGQRRVIMSRQHKMSIPNKLPHYTMPVGLRQCVLQGKELTSHAVHLTQNLSMKNYITRMTTLLHLEELQNEQDLLQYGMERVCLQRVRQFLALTVLGLCEGRPSVQVDDCVVLSSPTDPDDPQYEGIVHEIHSNRILLKFNEDFHHYYNDENYNVSFSFNRTSIRRCHQACHTAVTQLGESVLFPKEVVLKKSQLDLAAIKDNLHLLYEEKDDEVCKRKPDRLYVPGINHYIQDSITFYNGLLNERQKTTVIQILLGQCRPLPYVVFGPPGTGKTITIVEAVLQVLTRVPGSRLIVCTPSNSAADLLTERLHESRVIKMSDMVRLNAAKRSLDGVCNAILGYCSTGEKLDVLCRFRVIVATCNTAGRLYTANLKPGHFTHAFVDEAGQATEPECLIPLGLVSGSDGQIVLAGDPMQLGPVLLSPYAKMYGLALSFLERMMQRAPYQRSTELYPEHGGFHSALVTMLVNNYRCHESILHLPSQLFYFDNLLGCAPHDLTHSLVGWHLLPNPDIPIIFHGVQGEDVREVDSPSWFNAAETVQVVTYLQAVLSTGRQVSTDKIGIITPYRKQVEKIRLMIDHLSIPRVKVGSVEEFQGQERLVIIISTVRSNEKCIGSDIRHVLGFLSNAKRFNVAITRAQALLIVIGNPHVLVEDDNWSQFIRMCVRMGCCCGCQLPPGLKPEGIGGKDVENSQPAHCHNGHPPSEE